MASLQQHEPEGSSDCGQGCFSEHQNLLEQYLEGGISEGVLSLGLVIDIEITAHLEQPRIYPDMNPADILMLAIQREQASHDLYFCLARIHPKGKVKQLLEEMARQELEHKRQLDLFDAEITFLPG